RRPFNACARSRELACQWVRDVVPSSNQFVKRFTARVLIRSGVNDKSAERLHAASSLNELSQRSPACMHSKFANADLLKLDWLVLRDSFTHFASAGDETLTGRRERAVSQPHQRD